MKDWETPPDFAAGILSASKLNILSKDLDWLQARADGPRAVFPGVLVEAKDATYLEVWEGWIRHQKDDFVYSIWTYDDTTVQILYDGDTVATVTPGEEGAWTEHNNIAAAYDVSAKVVGTWYKVQVKMKSADQPAEGNVLVALLEERETISGWNTVGVFTATEAALDTDLDELAANLTTLKGAADSPEAPFAGIGWHVPSSTAVIPEYYPGGRKFAGGFIMPPGSAQRLYMLFDVFAGQRLEVFITDDSAWGAAVHDTTYASTVYNYEELIDITGAGLAVNNPCRLYFQVRDTTSGSYGRFYMKYMGILDDRKASATTLPYWSHGRGLDFADLNTLRTTAQDLADNGGSVGDGKLGKYRNPAVRSYLLTAQDYESDYEWAHHTIRRHGFRYLHYNQDTDHKADPKIHYWAPSTGNWDEYHLADSTTATSIDIEKLDHVRHGMMYSIHNTIFCEEWDDS